MSANLIKSTDRLYRVIVGTAVSMMALYIALMLYWGPGSRFLDLYWVAPVLHGFAAMAVISIAFLALGRHQVSRDSVSYARRETGTLSRSTWLTISLFLAAIAVLCATSAAFGQGPNNPLRFVGNENIPPIIFAQDGKPAGLVVDLAYALADKAHLSIRVEPMDWSEAQSLVLSGKADALLQINPTPAREQLYDFSDTLLESNFHLFRKNTRVDILDLTSLYGKKIGVERDGYPFQYLKQYRQIQTVVVPDWKAGFELLNAGQIDAVLVDRWVGEYQLYLNKIKGVTIVQPPVVSSDSRIAVKKGNTQLLDRINFGLKEIERDGTRQRILDKWQAKEIVYVTRESIGNVIRWAAAGIIVLLVIVALRAVAYSRAIKKLNHELAEKNEMLLEARENLEEKVSQRTAELKQANTALKTEAAERERTEDVLKESETKYRNLFENMTEEVHFWKLVRDEDGSIKTWRLVDANPPALKTWDKTLEEIKGKTTDEIFGTGATDHFMAVVQKIMTEGVPHVFEDFFPHLDKWFRFTSVPLGEYFITTGADITAIKKSHEALRESEERFYLILSSMNSGILLVDDEGRIQFANGAFCDIFGFMDSPADLLGLTASEMIERIRPAYKDPDAAVARIREIVSLGQPVRGEDVGMCSERTFLRDYVPIRIGDRDYGRLWIHTDITDRKQAEEELASAHAQAERHAAEIESFMRNLGEGVGLFDADGMLIMANDAVRRMIGAPENAPLAEWYKGVSLLETDGRPVSIEDYPSRLALRGETLKDHRYIARSPWVEGLFSITATPVRDATGSVTGAAVVWHDIAEQVSIEARQQELFEREHRIASVLQEAILPPEVPSEVLGYRIAVKYRPALAEAEIGGDFYDVFELGDGRFAVMIGDVVGKGLKAAMRVAAARHSVRSYAYIDPRPARVLTMANNALSKEGADESQMLTLFYAVVDPGIGGIMYAGAGHEPPIICHADGECEDLKANGIPLGFLPGFEYEQSSRPLHSGDVIVMVTDGITEARAPGPVLFGKERLTEFVKGHLDRPLEEIATGLLDSALAHADGHLQDDAAVLVLGAGEQVADSR